ncbi:MAG: DUF5682 family protein, partial [Pirellulaceae bacterium]|nr:DUF5682 family protein [Pirellulaceae bacterium]
PAGIRDPMWQERSLLAAREHRLDQLASSVIVEVARKVRSRHLVAGVPDASEAVRMAEDLARLRGLSAPGRREFSVSSAVAASLPSLPKRIFTSLTANWNAGKLEL